MKITTQGLLALFIACADVFPATVATADITPTNSNMIPQYFLTSFSPLVTGGMLIFTGMCPTNLYSMTGTSAVYQSHASFRDSSMIKLGNQFVVTYNNEQSNSAEVISSPDMTNWSYYATLYVPDQFDTFWSPKYVTDDSSTVYMTAFVQNVSDYNYNMGVGVMSPDLTQLQNFSLISLSNNGSSRETDPNSSAIYYHQHVYYLFTGDGNEYTSTNILANHWTLLTQGLVYGAGKTVAEWNGMFYLTASELGSTNWSITADLTNWVNVSLPNALLPHMGTIGREGCFFTMLVPGAPADSVSLTIAQTGNGASISWPAVGNYTLLQSPQISGGVWTTNATQAVYLNGTNSVAIPLLQSNMFFRLEE